MQKAVEFKNSDGLTLRGFVYEPKKYDTAIKYVDEQIGRIIDFLKKDGLWKDTIFIVLADHGESLGEHRIYFSHAGIYVETVHVPLIMKLPGFRKRVIMLLIPGWKI